MSSIERSLRLLEIVVESQKPYTHSELARALDIPKSTLTKILKLLQKNGYLGSDGRRYLPGIRLLSLVHRTAIIGDIRSAIRPFMDKLSLDTGETVLLGILAGNLVTYIDQAPSAQPIRYVTTLGQPRPLHSTALGRVLLAFSGRTASSLGTLTRQTTKTVTSPATLDKILRQVREDGYAINVGESVEGVTAVAAPLLSARGDVIAALSVTGPSSRLGDIKERVWPLLKKAVASIEKSGLPG
jgi:DNA-binding IclR family transcriptional regulator